VVVLRSGAADAATHRDDLRIAKQAVIANYAAIVHASYQDALSSTRILSSAIDDFLQSPTDASLEKARRAWIDARVPYTQTEAYRFYDGPIDAVDGRINAWPIDESLIDYVDGEPSAGIISNVRGHPSITRDLIVSLNERDGEKSITAGFHSIEFLLWGQDLNDDGPGRRSYRDYVDQAAAHADRRREYLRIVAHLLVADLQRLTDEWAPGDPENYRARFLALPPDEALACILKGVGILSGAELAGERLTVPYETKEQEDEHSCFSDNTDRDILFDMRGIENVLRGRFQRASGERIEGPSVLGLIAKVDPSLAATLGQQLEDGLAAAAAIPHPFDRAITGVDSAPGRVAIKRVIAALRAQSDSIARAGAVLGLRLNF
jgi:putative iron-regulated protein